MKFHATVTGWPSGIRYQYVMSASSKEQARKRVLRQLQSQFPSEQDFNTDNICQVNATTPSGIVT